MLTVGIVTGPFRFPQPAQTSNGSQRSGVLFEAVLYPPGRSPVGVRGSPFWPTWGGGASRRLPSRLEPQREREGRPSPWRAAPDISRQVASFFSV